MNINHIFQSAFMAVLFLAIAGCEKKLSHTSQEEFAPGWVAIIADPQKYDKQPITIRGILATTESGSGSGVELWIAEWAKVQGQLEFLVHLEEESTNAFFGGNNTDKVRSLDGKLVEIEGVFIARTKESMTGRLPGIGNIKSIMMCHPGPTGSRGGEILQRPLGK